MVKSLHDKLYILPKRRQAAIQRRAEQLIAEEMTLRDLRLALQKTQQDLSGVLHMSQDGVSRLEKRTDMLLSTLNKYVMALGGSLKIIAEFPNKPAVLIQGLADIGHV